MEVNLTDTFKPTRDRGNRAGSIVLRFPTLEPIDPWLFLNSVIGRTCFFRMIVRAEGTGKLHDVTGRRGVYDSKQEGHVLGIGMAMTDEGRDRFGILTVTKKKVNTGAGFGYRSWFARNVICFVVGKQVVLTKEGAKMLKEVLGW